MTTPDIPLLDIALWRDGTARQRERLASRMDQALRESGFLLIGNHGVPAGLRDRIRDEARGFFALPPAQGQVRRPGRRPRLDPPGR
jgi:isopenicillin N synthase-like dioxygenase